VPFDAAPRADVAPGDQKFADKFPDQKIISAIAIATVRKSRRVNSATHCAFLLAPVSMATRKEVRTFSGQQQQASALPRITSIFDEVLIWL
jgi:ABC-type polar amino acid transport system ATPase subunit